MSIVPSLKHRSSSGGENDNDENPSHISTTTTNRTILSSPFRRGFMTNNSSTGTRSGGLFTKYFLIVLVVFGLLSLVVNNRVTYHMTFQSETGNMLEDYLRPPNSMRSGTNSMSSSSSNKMNKDGNKRNQQQAQGQQLQQQQLPENRLKKFPNDDEEDEEEKEGQEDTEDNEDTNEDVRDQPKQHQGVQTDKISTKKIHQHQLAGLNCDSHGGPPHDVAQEMVYWEDIPEDTKYISPFRKQTPQYMTFEPDRGGWNNIRMAMVRKCCGSTSVYSCCVSRYLDSPIIVYKQNLSIPFVCSFVSSFFSTASHTTCSK